jgi:hypothetical protein
MTDLIRFVWFQWLCTAWAVAAIYDGRPYFATLMAAFAIIDLYVESRLRALDASKGER